MSTSKQVYHLKFPCPDCGDLLHYQTEDSMISNRPAEGLFCQNCDGYKSYILIRTKIWSEIQSQRRRQKNSKGKNLLKEYELKNPVQLNENSWIVYDFGLSGKVNYDSKNKSYTLITKDFENMHFEDVSELRKHLNNIYR